MCIIKLCDVGSIVYKQTMIKTKSYKKHINYTLVEFTLFRGVLNYLHCFCLNALSEKSFSRLYAIGG